MGDRKAIQPVISAAPPKVHIFGNLSEPGVTPEKNLTFKVVQNHSKVLKFLVTKFYEEGAFKFLTQLCKSGSLLNIWLNLATRLLGLDGKTRRSKHLHQKHNSLWHVLLCQQP